MDDKYDVIMKKIEKIEMRVKYIFGLIGLSIISATAVCLYHYSMTPVPDFVQFKHLKAETIKVNSIKGVEFVVDDGIKSDEHWGLGDYSKYFDDDERYAILSRGEGTGYLNIWGSSAREGLSGNRGTISLAAGDWGIGMEISNDSNIERLHLCVDRLGHPTLNYYDTDGNRTMSLMR